ncbi:unnamed protein product [Oikopleura dioica]|uniref:RNA helicase n=1 Tax=Oikopleura dioica TaxID=34765 RepID=E4Y7R1_OIKDI|nr:unnamed protein product [Oikopleura dioica]
MKVWRPGTSAPEEAILLDAGSGDKISSFNPNSNMSLMQQRQRLPIFQWRNHILWAVENFQTLVLVGETGCGKSTQIPQYLHEAGWTSRGYQVCVTQPRRVAAVTLATRVADEKGAMIGTSIGYAVRFDSKQDEEQTRVKFVTDGVLLQEMTSDPLLRRYSVIMIDEAHERSLQTDMCLGLLKKIQKVRPDLRIIVASATLDAEFFKGFFNHNLTDNSEADTATIIHLEGRTYPVDIFYLEKACPDYMKESMETVLKIHRENKFGDILVFVTSAEDCDSLCDNLRDEVGKVISKAQGIGVPLMKMKALPLYGSLPVIDQMRVFESLPRNTRKVIVSTNIAETSLTLPGIVHVIDAGFVKISAYNPKNGLDSTTTVPVSQAAANQRAGRAGRVRSGCCYRLYTQDDFEKLMKATVPEMRRSELTSTILRLKQLGISNVVRFDFPSPPPAQALSRSLELLFALGAVDEECELTEKIGERIAELPLHPFFAKMLLASIDYECVREILTMVALLSVRTIFQIPPGRRQEASRNHRRFQVEEGDHISMLNAFETFEECERDRKFTNKRFLNHRALVRVGQIRTQLSKFIKRWRVEETSARENVFPVLKAITAGLFPNAAILRGDGLYETVRDAVVLQDSALADAKRPPKCVLYTEITQGKYMREVSVIEQEWLTEISGHYYQNNMEE